MSLFNFGNKKDETKKSCCYRENSKAIVNTNLIDRNITSVKVLGMGCKSCHQQYEYVKIAVQNLGLNVEVEYITDMQKIMEYGAMSMPTIIVNEKVVSMGKVLKSVEVEKLLQKVGV